MLLFLSLCISVTFFFSLSTSFSHLSLSCRLNFKDPEAVRALTCTLLKEDFGLNIEIPLERLIPTVPLRLNYIHWVEDLTGAQGSPSRGIDIGTCSSLMQYHIPGSQLPAAHKALTTGSLSWKFSIHYTGDVTLTTLSHEKSNSGILQPVLVVVNYHKLYAVPTSSSFCLVIVS